VALTNAAQPWLAAVCCSAGGYFAFTCGVAMALVYSVDHALLPCHMGDVGAAFTLPTLSTGATRCT